MQLQPTHPNTILQFSTIQPQQQSAESYFIKHWQVISTTVRFFVLEKVAVNLVAFRKSLELLVGHNCGGRLMEQLEKMWGEIFGEIISKLPQTNPLINLIQHYKVIQPKLNIIFTILKSYLNPYNSTTPDCLNPHNHLTTYPTLTPQHTAFNTLCKLILHSPYHHLYQQQMILLIAAFRNCTYSTQTIISEENCREQVQVDLLILKKIGLFRHLQQQFDATSKQFYVGLSEEIPKGDQFLNIVNEYLQREIQLNKIFEPEKSTVYYVEKQLIKEYYQFVLDQLLEKLICNRDYQQLKIFWNFTLRLGNQAMVSFYSKLKQIILGVKRYFVATKDKTQVFKVIDSREQLLEVCEKCFEKDRKVINLVYNSFEEVLYEEEKHYLFAVFRNVLDDEQVESSLRAQLTCADKIQTQPSHPSDKTTLFFKLFRISPSKQNFIRQFEHRFSKFILHHSFHLKSLQPQQTLIHMMRKQVGSNLIKRLQRMLTDVWRSSTMHYHQATVNGTEIKCMFLSSEWPVQLAVVHNQADELYGMLNEFEVGFKRQVENREKTIRWVMELGEVTVAVNGVESTFSEIQTSVILLLSKSIRPLKFQQIQASLNICNMTQSSSPNFSPTQYLSNILTTLVTANILSFNPGPQTYDINQQNQKPYKHQKPHSQNSIESGVRKHHHERDNSILIEAAIVKILKKRKNMQRSDVTRFIEETIKNFRPTFEQVTKAFEKLQNSHYIEINRQKGIISYVQ